MKAFLRRLVPSLGHLSDETLSRMINDELGSLGDMRAEAHLASCWQCRARSETCEEGCLEGCEYRKARVALRLPADPKGRRLFLSEMDKVLSEAPPAPWWWKVSSYLRPTAMANMNPVIASVMVVVFAAILLFAIWQRSMPSVSASELLHRAETWDKNSSPSGEPGVIYQKVQIRTPHASVERNLYRDREGRRVPKSEPVGADFTPLKAKLNISGVKCDDPLSASSYKSCRDSQSDESDQVRRSGKNLLTVTTKTSGGIVV